MSQISSVNGNDKLFLPEEIALPNKTDKNVLLPNNSTFTETSEAKSAQEKASASNPLESYAVRTGNYFSPQSNTLSLISNNSIAQSTATKGVDTIAQAAFPSKRDQYAAVLYGKGIDVADLANHIRSKGKITIAVFDDFNNFTSHGYGVHQLLESTLKGLGVDPKLFEIQDVSIMQRGFINAKRDLTSATNYLADQVRNGNIDMVVGGMDFNEDFDANRMSQWLGRRVTDFDQVSSADLDTARQTLSRYDSRFGGLLNTLGSVAYKVPFMYAGGNGGTGNAMMLVPHAVRVGAIHNNGDAGQTARYLDVYENGATPSDFRYPTQGADDSALTSRSVPRSAAIAAEMLLKKAGLR